MIKFYAKFEFFYEDGMLYISPSADTRSSILNTLIEYLYYWQPPFPGDERLSEEFTDRLSKLQTASRCLAKKGEKVYFTCRCLCKMTFKGPEINNESMERMIKDMDEVIKKAEEDPDFNRLHEEELKRYEEYKRKLMNGEIDNIGVIEEEEEFKA